MKYIFIVFYVLANSYCLLAQNLVANPSFEELNDEYEFHTNISPCKYWDEPMYLTYVSQHPSADYFHADFNASGNGTPCNWLFARIGINDCIGDIQYPQCNRGIVWTTHTLHNPEGVEQQ